MKFFLATALCLAGSTSVWAQADDAILGDESVDKTQIIEEVRAGVTFHDKFYGDFAFGVVVHDGVLDFGDALATARERSSNNSFRYAINKNWYGSRVLFRQQLTLGINLSEDWAAEGFVEHISHGRLLSNGPNEGSDAAGFRINRKF